MPEPTLAPWEWALMGVGVLLFLIGVAGVMYYLINKGNKVNSKHKSDAKDIPSRSTDEEAIDEDIMTNTTTTIEASITSSTDNSMQQKEAHLYGQRFALVTPASTALSPPRSQQQQQHHHPLKTTSSIDPAIHKIQEETEDSNKLRVFSLSPLHQTPQSSDSPSSSFRNNRYNTDSVCSNSSNTTHRTMTPFQGNTPTISDAWRGPTPPWTQYPGR